MRAGLPKKEPEILARWAQPLQGAARGSAGPREVRPPRRPALRQRPHPHRHRAQQDPEGLRRPLPPDAGLRRQLRAGLGLPRPSDRVEGRGGLPRRRQEQGRDPDQRIPQGMPGLRRRLARRPARGVQAPRRDRRLRRPVHDDELQGRGADRARADEVRHVEPALPRLQAGDVVGGGAHGARRGRGRVSRLPVRHDRGRLPGQARQPDGGDERRPPQPVRARHAGRRGDGDRAREGVGGDLDDHAVDDPRQPRHRLRPRPLLRHLRGDRRPRRQLGEDRRPLRDGRQARRRHLQGRPRHRLRAAV